jgi:hypothetical protein
MALQFSTPNPYRAGQTIESAYARIMQTDTHYPTDHNAETVTIRIYTWHDYQARADLATPIHAEAITAPAADVRALAQPGDDDPRKPMYRYIKALPRYADAIDV